MNVELVNNVPIGVASIRVYRPKTGLTAASIECAIACGIFTRAKLSPATRSDDRVALLVFNCNVFNRSI